METHPTKTVFVTGTDTDVGKTYVASLLARTLVGKCQRVGVYKPVASGCIPATIMMVDGQPELNPGQSGDSGGMVATDAFELWRAAGMPRRLDDVCPQRFALPVAPPAAAAAENREVDAKLLVDGAAKWRSGYDWLIVEGAGGFMSPLADGLLNIDLYRQLGQPKLLVVAANRLGTIHQSLATCLAAQQLGCEVSGLLLNAVQSTTDSSCTGNAEQIRRYSNVEFLGTVDYQQTTLPDNIIGAIEKWFA
ncbi:dethiobiotin synthase [Stieleria varia]|uniref:ATP-dependent dethiobiotin synthetase BioD n=1 Tax=Stieleria varia TaxID=2528005 RepID=A0A5C6B1G4_9BACT|nr:dethiobiotin synthase [Stieleria varia]TWU05076.1 ATP-dependent dethiobiotin synthetase BioD 1 [Stieleria varia]